MEAIVCIGAMFGCWFFAVIVDGLTDKSAAVKIAALACICAAFIYFLIRFIHWAWVTPMPWSS